jgi:hypothetical protein
MRQLKLARMSQIEDRGCQPSCALSALFARPRGVVQMPQRAAPLLANYRRASDAGLCTQPLRGAEFIPRRR